LVLLNNQKLKMMLIAMLAFIGFTMADEPGQMNVHLHEKCTLHSDCYNSWAYCTNDKVCECFDGFIEVDGNCEPKDLYCPRVDGVDPTTDEKKSCEVGYDLEGGIRKPRNDANCSDAEFCFVHSASFTTEGYLFGHCCPKLTPGSSSRIDPICPTTPAPKPDLTCGLDTTTGTCDADGLHTCNQTIIDNSDVKSCCPVSCPDESGFLQIAIDGTGRCFSMKNEGDLCEYTAQCEGGRCVVKGMDKRCVMDHA
jgi:hypothetical protein